MICMRCCDTFTRWWVAHGSNLALHILHFYAITSNCACKTLKLATFNYKMKNLHTYFMQYTFISWIINTSSAGWLLFDKTYVFFCAYCVLAWPKNQKIIAFFASVAFSYHTIIINLVCTLMMCGTHQFTTKTTRAANWSIK